MRNSVFEIVLGAVVIIAAGLCLAFALNQTSASGSGDSYELTARFNNVVGVSSGTDVRLAGVKVGRVANMTVDPKRAEAVLTLAIQGDVILPDDSDAKISSDGLLGGAFVSVEPGGSLDTIATDGSGEILYTRGSVDILTLFASMMGNQDSGSEQEGY